MSELSAVKRALVRIEELERENERLRRSDPIAVVGMSCRFPGGVRTPRDYWRLLEEGREAIGEVPPSRWNAGDFYDADAEAAGKAYTRAGGFLEDDVYAFDAAFFGITPLEALALDPQQRLLLELAWEAIEHAGVPAERLRGASAGVFVGISAADYAQARLHSGDPARIGAYDVTGLIGSTAAGRIAYTFDLRGPAMAIDTACSSSLVAIDLACASLRDGSSDWALAAGVNVILTPQGHICFSKMRALSPDGHCRTFDAGANGFVRSEGGGMLLLRRLSDARRDGNRILALIRGSAVNQDGRSNGMTAPNLKAQEAVVRAALARAGVAPHDVGYIEAHGTGTPLGDPIELEALANVFARDRAHPLFIGSVKTNLGHLETAAGMASILKVILAFEHRSLPPHLHLSTPTPHVDWAHLPFRIPTSATPWESNGAPRFAGVSGFGFGGTNAHVILEEAPAPVILSRPSTSLRTAFDGEGSSLVPREKILRSAQDDSRQRDIDLLLVSAKSEDSLAQMVEAYQTWIAETPNVDLADVCAASRVSRSHLPHRAAFLVENGTLHATPRTPAADRPRLAFLFTGQGSQYANMARDLYECEPLFRARFDECDALLRAPLGFSIADVVFNGAGDLDDTLHTQPVLFALGWSLAELWRSRGVEPAAVAGHSIGEYTAAAVAGVLSLEDACRLVAARAKAMHALPRVGGMLSVFESAEAIAPLLDEQLAIAAINAPRATVVSGELAALDALAATLAARGIHARRLAVSHAFHSPLMRDAASTVEQAAASMRMSAPRIALVSNVTADAMTAAPSPAYWSEHLLRPVRFLDSMRALRARGITAFLEIGPSPALCALGRQIDGDAVWVASLRKGTPDERSLALALASLYTHGVPVDWTRLGAPRRPVDLPAYRFDRKRYVAFTTPTENPMTAPVSVPEVANVDEIAARLGAIVSEATGLESVARDANLLELGVDSLMLMQTRHQITQKFGVEIPISEFFERLTSVGKIASFLAESGGSGGQAILPVQSNSHRRREDRQDCLSSTAAAPAPVPNTPDVFTPYKRIQTEANESRDARQKEHLETLVREFCDVTDESKRETQRHRAHFANNRNVAGFRPAWKEMIYQVIAESADGARIRTRGGRELIDFTMGFGVHLFGHNAPFIREAVARELANGVPLGPMYHLAGEVAEAFCELTGNERVAFYNSGTEAVMVALRIARTATQRNRIVIFEGSYHGSFDGILALRSVRDGQLQTIPGAPGTTQGMVDDVLVLRYDDPESLEIIRAQGSELAAVLVEPVQSRRPDLRPREFLHALREITAKSGTALIIDEVVTGFRCHPQGAQGYFGVRADLATYGKVVGGGMPIGLVAGKAEFMDAVDGGAWVYGDDSYPKRRNTFVAGTFCHHPLTLAAMKAVLARLKDAGPALQEELNHRNAAFCERLNRFFEEEEVPIKMAYFGSLFRFVLRGDAELLFFHLIRRGFYIWEGRNCFLSTAHTDEDVERLYHAVVDSVYALRKGGVIAERAQQSGGQAILPVRAPGVRSPGEDRRDRLSSTSTTEFSLFFFSSANNVGDDKYRLLLDAATYADRNGYAAIWTPERHFHDFGGLYPNPAITSAALATITENVRIRAGSTVLLLHDPIRFAENWSLVDNLSRGRVDLALALGWNSNDFALAPDRFEDRARLFPEHLDVVKRLWRGETIVARGGKGEAVRVELHPRPVQRELPVWFVAPGNPETFRIAGEQGANLLTYLEGQTVEQLAEKLALYRDARQRNGHRGRGHVTCMLHTFVGDDLAAARATVAAPLKTYLRSSLFLRNQLLTSLGLSTDGGDIDPIIERALDRYLETSSLIGTLDSCLPMVQRLREIGVDELGCLIDFGLDYDTTMRGLESLTALMQRAREAQWSGGLQPAEQTAEGRQAESLSLHLTPEQKELWAAAQIDPESTAYNEAVLLQVGGTLDEARLRGAVQALAARHDALRVVQIDGETQRVAPFIDAPFELATDDASLLRPFDLRNGPLWRVVLLRDQRLYIVAHHIIANGWSLGLFVEELSALYAGKSLPSATPLRAFLDWQSSRQTQTIDTVPPLELPSGAAAASPADRDADRDGARSGYRSTQVGGRQAFTIDGELYGALKRASKERGATLVMTMFAAFELLLARVSGQRRFVVGVPLSGQAAMGAVHLAGQCTSIMPVVCDLAEEWMLDEVVRDARRALLEMHAHANVRFTTPPLAAMFNMDRAPSMTEFAGLPMTVLTAPIGDAKVDLFANLIDFGDRVVIEIDYRRALIEDAVAVAWSDAYRRILEALADPAAGTERAFAIAICETNDVRDERGQPLPLGAEGEWKNSGDLVRARGDGSIEWRGRVDRRAIVNGRRVNLALVESLLRRVASEAHASVNDAQELIASVVLPESMTAADLRRAMRALAPPHLIPAWFEIDGVLERGSDEPETDLERRLAPIWNAVLRVASCDPDDSFFELGGQSVQAAQLVARVRQELRVDLELRELFERPTLRALARLLEGRAPSEHPPIPAAPTQDDYPLSHAQKRLWLSQQLDPAMTAYNIPLAAWLDGPLDVARLQQAFDVVAERHESLRTMFVSVDGEPRQRLSDRRPRLEVIDVDDDAAVLRELDHDAACTFALDEPPLVRARLLRTPRRHALALDLHHIIADGWSAGVLVRELAALYRGAAPSELPPLPIRYSDFAVWQSTAAANDEAGRRYWLSRFATGVPRLSLRTDAPRPMVRRYAGSRMRLVFGDDVAAAVHAFARDAGTSPFLVLLAATKALLHRITGDDDITTGVPVGGRGRPELDHQVGLFVNTLPLRDEVRGDWTFRRLADRVRRNAVDAFAHGDYPLDLVVEQLDLPRDWSRTPLFDVVVTSDDVEGEAFDFGDVRVTRADVPQRTSLFDLVFHFIEDHSALRLDLDYDTALFRPESIALLQQRLAVLLRAATTSPDDTIAAIDLTTDSERSAAGFRLEASFRL